MKDITKNTADFLDDICNQLDVDLGGKKEDLGLPTQ